jgi:hypothetical protein
VRSIAAAAGTAVNTASESKTGISLIGRRLDFRAVSSTNGKRKPPRPKIELVSGGASEDEAAAIVAALEQFLAETAPAPDASRPAQSPWQRAALEEGIAARQVSGSVWGRSPG